MASDKYTKLVGEHDGIRVRVERLDGRWAREIWWDRELIAFLTNASPRRVKPVKEWDGKGMCAIDQHDIQVDEAEAGKNVLRRRDFKPQLLRIDFRVPAKSDDPFDQFGIRHHTCVMRALQCEDDRADSRPRLECPATRRDDLIE